MNSGAPIERDTSERLSADDLATRREEEFLAAALRRQASQAVQAPRAIGGVCMNCAERCLPPAVYCDEDCRADHEARVRARQRGRGGSTALTVP